MRFFNALRLRTKLTMLFILIGLGLSLIGIVGYINITSMKKNLDALYFGSFIPVNELNEMLHTYNTGVGATVVQLSSGTLDPFQASAQLSADLDTINRLWDDYSSHYKSDGEKEYIQFATLTIERANHHISRIIDVCHQGLDVRRISAKSTAKIIVDVTDVISKLLLYEKEVAHHERKKLLMTYDNTIIQIVLIFGVIFGGVLWISYTLFVSIQRQQQTLEAATEDLKIANSKLENASYTDSLTGLSNRRHFNMVFERELKRAKRSGKYFTFMMLDIDYFKRYNDTYGHLEGDNALKAVGELLKSSLKRPGDFVFRLGGEEFGILITEGDPDNARKMARMVCDGVEGLQIVHERNDASSYLTASIGCLCLIPSVDLDENLIISTADANLYIAKECGRNDIIVTTEISDQNPHPPKVDAA